MHRHTDFAKAMNVLNEGGIEFIIVGGVAAVLHGGISCRRANLDRLILMKRAAGRPKDFEVLSQLEALLEEQQRLGEERP